MREMGSGPLSGPNSSTTSVRPLDSPQIAFDARGQCYQVLVPPILVMVAVP